jgi:DnaJ-class molecular chaperone
MSAHTPGPCHCGRDRVRWNTANGHSPQCNLARIAKEALCRRCGGSGTTSALIGGGPDAYEESVDCHECKGTGAALALVTP